MGSVRFTFNQGLAAINEKRASVDIKELRTLCVNNDSPLVRDNPWLKEVPYDVRDEGIRDLIKAFQSNWAKQKKDPSHKFDIKFRRRKAPSETITIHAKHWRGGKFHPRLFGRGPIKLAEPPPPPERMLYDMRIQRSSLGDFKLCIPQPLEKRDENQVPSLQQSSVECPPGMRPVRVAAIDPGVRSFATVYDVSGRIAEFASGDISRLHRLCRYADKLQSRFSKTPDADKLQSDVDHAQNDRKRRSMHRAWLRMFERIRNLRKDMHRRVAKWLCASYDVILLPKFETSQMVLRGYRRIKSNTVRKMLTWSHYSFQQHLLHKAKEFGVRVEIVTEEYTSKTCGRCGTLHHKLGGQKVFKCPNPQCRLVIDRDWNGARNIFLKNIGLVVPGVLGPGPLASGDGCHATLISTA